VVKTPGALLACLQLSDRGQVVLRNEGPRARAGFASRSRGEHTVKGLEALRNNLAHSQDIITCDWQVIVKLTGNLDKFSGSRAAEARIAAIESHVADRE
jgi:hypothetical protein